MSELIGNGESLVQQAFQLTTLPVENSYTTVPMLNQNVVETRYYNITNYDNLANIMRT